MKKTLLIVSAVLILLFGGVRLLLYKFEPTKEFELRLRAAALPELTLLAADGSRKMLTPGKPIVLVYFNSTCDHCQRQVDALVTNLSMFEGTTVMLMSSQSQEDIVAFAATLPNSRNLHVVQCMPEEIAQKFGVLALPQIFVYDAKGALAGLFYGETDAKTLLGALGL